MEWKLSLTRAEYWLIGLLVLAQLAFWARHIVVLKRLQAHSKNLWPKALIRIGYVSLLFVAILGPVLGTVEESLMSNSRSIWFLLDVSESMNATDVLPSRLERAKKMISNVVEQQKSDKVGLIVFADKAYMQCPLTYDKEAFLLFLQSINTNQILNQGTQIHEAFQMLLMKADSVSKSKPIESKVALLFTDGEDFGIDAEASINKLTEAGFRVSCVGVGNPIGGAIPTKGGSRFLLDDKGERIISKLNEAALEALALEGKGQYFGISGKTDNPEDVVRWINTQKALSVVAHKHSIAADKYHYPLTIALFLIVLDVVFTFSTVKFK